MKKTLFTLLAVLMMTAPFCFAQTDKHPERTKLAEQTYEALMKASSGYDQLNINADRAYYQKELKDHPELFTALYENIIFDYCKVDASLKDDENRKVEELTGKTWYTVRSFPEWLAIGKEYVKKRSEIDKK